PWPSATRISTSSDGSTGRLATQTSVFFFQAEDGIRGRTVTGVQTCALPIFRSYIMPSPIHTQAIFSFGQRRSPALANVRNQAERSEERRVGKECRSRRSMEQ